MMTIGLIKKYEDCREVTGGEVLKSVDLNHINSSTRLCEKIPIIKIL